MLLSFPVMSSFIFMTMEMESAIGASPQIDKLTKHCYIKHINCKGGDEMGELKREIEVIKQQCAQDPGAKANWSYILLLLGVCVMFGALSLLLLA